MIQFSEGLWMDAFIIALIGAAGALIAAIVSGIYSNRKINKELALHDQKSLSGHEALSKEHQGLAKDTEKLTTQINAQFSRVSHDVHVIRERQTEDRVKQELQYSNLSEAQKHLAQSAVDVGKFVQEFGRLVAENQQLRQENMRLQQNLQDLQITLEKLQRTVHPQQNRPNPQAPSLRDDGLEPDF